MKCRSHTPHQAREALYELRYTFYTFIIWKPEFYRSYISPLIWF